MKALKCGTLGASFGKPCASGYVEGILDEYIVRMYIHVYNYFRVVGSLVRSKIELQIRGDDSVETRSSRFLRSYTYVYA